MSQRRVRVRVDPTRCTAFGFCAEFFPESFALDDWGYAWLQAAELPSDLEPLARETARLCPTGAIAVEIVRAEDGPPAAATARPARLLRPRHR
ncbi:MAG: ferredoxin [Sphaerobacter sp.]|nr:ferredoxin [Sphaerobacter sp.]